MVTNSDDQLKQLASRLDHIERILQSQIQRIHAVEARLGVTPAPVASSVSPAVPPEPPPIPSGENLSRPSPNESLAASFQPLVSEATQTYIPETYQESLESKIGGNL